MDQIPNEPIGIDEPPSVPTSSPDDESRPTWLTRKEYTDPAEKKKDFWLGFGLWWVLNILLTLCQWGVSIALFSIPSTDETLATVVSIGTMILYILPWLINIGLIIYLAFTRSQMALGMLAGFGSALALVICLGVIATVACFALLGSYN